jgi:hypothetical protein
MYATTFMNPPFWTTRDNVYNYTNSIPAAVYAYAWCKEQPSNKTLPYELEETFYTGMAGGMEDDYIADKKNIDSDKMSLQTLVHQRLKKHNSYFSNPLANFHGEERKYNLYHETYNPFTTVDKTLYICLLVPKPHIKKEEIRSYISLVESEIMVQYSIRFGHGVPLLNLAEYWNNDSRKVKDSHSQQHIQSLRENNLWNLAAG